MHFSKKLKATFAKIYPDYTTSDSMTPNENKVGSENRWMDKRFDI